ncbi:ATPase family AAA domain-containing protein 5-like, partial [Nilaparvata lugens]|uniref:ATPase family AAA domain-containing protein 5-like n=1 Tax=Nilaparvata lugens TaxID=108931 RepID=UPI00193E7496
RKVKKKKTKNKPVKSDGSSKKRSLILVEDADLLFEGFDEGFISAIAALSLTSKRPMVFTVNNKKPQHFSKFVRPSDLMLEFQRPSSSNLASWLQMIAMAEGIHLDDVHAELLANWSNNDIRKSLVQLVLAQSCEEIAKWPKFIDRARWPSAVTKDDIFDTQK